MRKTFLPIVYVCFLVSTICVQQMSFAAPTEQSASTGKTRKHQVVKDDTWYSLAKKYAVPYADLRAANSGVSDTLRIGDTLTIPAAVKEKQKNSAQEKKKSPDAEKVTKAGVYHTVKAGENLTQIAKKYSVSVEQLTEWNHLSSNALKAGQQLKIKEVAQPQTPKDSMPSSLQARAAKADSTVVPVAKKELSVVTVRTTDSASGKTTSRGEMIVPENQVSEAFAKGRKEITEEGAAAWIEDQEINPGKYFALHRSAPIGTIVKVTNRMNRRTVFVKVVGKLPDTGENENIVLKISKAAADKLGVLDARFQAQLNYGVNEK
jgi:LysM repeat protein